MDKTEIEIKIKQIHDKISPDGMSSREKNEVIEELDSILSIDPDNVDALFLKAMTYNFVNDYENAIKMYEEVLKLDPNRELVQGQINACKIMLETRSIMNDVNTQNNTSSNSAGRKNFGQKISVWHILIFKLIALAAVIYLFLIPLLNRI